MCNLSEGIWEKAIDNRNCEFALKMLKKGSSDADILEMTEISSDRLEELKQQLLEPVQ